MHSRQGLPALIVCLLLSQHSQATSIYRCTDASGHTTFTDAPCPAQQQATELQALQVNHIQPPRQQEPYRLQSGRVLSTGLPDDGCGNVLPPQERRNAQVRKQIYTGMPRADLERALGKPDSITGSDNRTRYHYQANGKHPARTITLDERGCVLGRKK